MNNEETHPNQNPFAISPPNWKDWGSVEKTKLWEAVALACNIDPGQCTVFGIQKLDRVFFKPSAQFEDLLILAKSNIGAGGMLKPISIGSDGIEESEVSLSNFTAWTLSISYKLPSEFPLQDQPSPQSPSPSNQGWPWQGNHETKLLRHLAAAANKFWSLYDPSDPTTAPTSKEVTAWLIQQGVAERNAKVIATILRADGLPSGPRK